MLGYTAFEQECGPYHTELKDLKIVKTFKGKQHPVTHRPPVSVSLGCHVVGGVPPKPSHDPLSAGSGAIKRIATKPGSMSRKNKRRFSRFVRLFLKRWIPKIDLTEDRSFESWIETTPYSAGRREELRQVWKENQNQLVNPLTVKTKYKNRVYAVHNFIKDEFYEAFKHPRMINSRSDLFKCMVGPIFAKISNKTFNLKFPGKTYGPLIKYVPVAERPVVLHDLLYRPSGNYQVTDYSSFEAHFTAEMMSIAEFQLYRHCTTDLPEGEDFMNLCNEAFTKSNNLHNKFFHMIIEATRMSGEMNTSLGNGFFNMMMCLFLANQKSEKSGRADTNHTMEEWIDTYYDHVKGVFEGDDGLCTFEEGLEPTTEDFTEMGLIIKLENFDNLGEASFCGNLFDEEDLVQITDPLYVMCTLGWTNRRYVRSSQETKHALLRCKSNSFLHAYPGCPIIQAMAMWALRVTPGNTAKEMRMIDQMDQWNKEQTLQAYAGQKLKPSKVPIRTRLLVNKLYGVSISQQIEIENWFEHSNKLEPIDIPCLKGMLDPVWVDNYNKHVIEYYDSEAIVTPNEIELARNHVEKMTTYIPSMEKLNDLL